MKKNLRILGNDRDFPEIVGKYIGPTEAGNL
jgi:hypothetical protein